MWREFSKQSGEEKDRHLLERGKKESVRASAGSPHYGATVETLGTVSVIAFPLDFQLTEIYLLTRLGVVKSTIKMLAREEKRRVNRVYSEVETSLKYTNTRYAWV